MDNGRVTKIWKPKKNGKTYSQAVTSMRNGVDEDDTWQGVDMTVKVEAKEWLQRSLVGWLQNREDLGILKDNFLLNGCGFIRLRYLGDNVVLMTGNEGEDLAKIIDQNKHRLEKVF